MDAVEKVTTKSFQIVITDWEDQPEAAFLLKTVRDLKAAQRPLTLAIVSDDARRPRALQAGAQGYVLKDAPVEDLINCIYTVLDGKTWIPPVVGAKLAKRVTERSLTTREMEVIRALAKGKSNKEIGVALNISEGTVKVHVTHMLEKLKVTGRTEAIGAAVKRGLVTMD